MAEKHEERSGRDQVATTNKNPEETEAQRTERRKSRREGLDLFGQEGKTEAQERTERDTEAAQPDIITTTTAEGTQITGPADLLKALTEGDGDGDNAATGRRTADAPAADGGGDQPVQHADRGGRGPGKAPARK